MSGLPGAPLPHLDGPAKVTGAALYAADHFAPDMLYGVIVGAPTPAGGVRVSGMLLLVAGRLWGAGHGESPGSGDA